MNAIQIIPAFKPLDWSTSTHNEGNKIRVSEFFYNTIQGEGIYAGHPAAFLRLTGCSLDCHYCDTTEVWRVGNYYHVRMLVRHLKQTGIIDFFRSGAHLVITGGSPLRQQNEVLHFLDTFKSIFGFLPFIEIENECTLMPYQRLFNMVDCWNNSPKLNNSGMPLTIRYKFEVIETMASHANSWFKFVIENEDDVKEIANYFLGKVGKEQIIFMPQGSTREELERTRPIVADLAIQYGVKYSDRLHVLLWDKKTGV